MCMNVLWIYEIFLQLNQNLINEMKWYDMVFGPFECLHLIFVIVWRGMTSDANFLLVFVEIGVQIIKNYFEECILNHDKIISSKLLQLEKNFNKTICLSLHQPIDQEIR